jgi:hypothetical protein
VSKLYRVVWEIDLYAVSPQAAAEKALQIQRDPESTATVFGVRKIKDAREMGSALTLVFRNDVVVDLSKTRRGKSR